MNIELHVFRVFVDKNKKFGNPAGIVLDEKKEISLIKRQSIATNSGFSEVVFINNLDSRNVSIFNPQKEVSFAGHALVGTAYFINKIIDKSVDFIECRGGKIKVWQKDDLTWIRSDLKNIPPWKYEQLQNRSLVENFPASKSSSREHTVVWAWDNEDKGVVRARTFASDWGIPEDEANGSGSMQLAAALGRDLEVLHGKGSVIYASFKGKDFVDVGGRVEQDESRSVNL